MLEKLAFIEEKFESIEAQLSEPSLYDDPAAAAKILKEQKELSPIVEAYRQYKKAERDAAGAQELLSGQTDAEMKELAQEELQNAKEDMERLEQELRILLLPTDPNDEKNVIVEIRGGAGGEEAALFAANLYRMYTMYAETRRWQHEIGNINETELGGIK